MPTVDKDVLHIMLETRFTGADGRVMMDETIRLVDARCGCWYCNKKPANYLLTHPY